MSSLKRHRGVMVPMATPFTSTGQLDEAAAARMVERLAAHRLGVFVLGTTGEAPSIPFADRQRLVEIAVKVAAGRVLVYGGIGTDCVPDSITMARDYHRAGADAVVALLPSYFQLNAAEMESCLAHIARSAPGDLLIYNMPLTTGMSIPLDAIDRLSALPNVVGLKDSENSPERLEAVAQRFAGRPNFSIFMGVAANGARAYRRGFDGVVPSSGNIAPAPWRDFDAAALAGDWDQVEALQTQLDTFGAIVQKGRSLAQSLAALKAACAAQGLCTRDVLPPLVPLDAAAFATLRQDCAVLGLV
jgi:4-hydroxy-tetrahydrodipicolinate synthase